jgi:hypothetical protein
MQHYKIPSALVTNPTLPNSDGSALTAFKEPSHRKEATVENTVHSKQVIHASSLRGNMSQNWSKLMPECQFKRQRALLPLSPL